MLNVGMKFEFNVENKCSEYKSPRFYTSENLSWCLEYFKGRRKADQDELGALYLRAIPNQNEIYSRLAFEQRRDSSTARIYVKKEGLTEYSNSSPDSSGDSDFTMIDISHYIKMRSFSMSSQAQGFYFKKVNAKAKVRIGVEFGNMSIKKDLTTVDCSSNGSLKTDALLNFLNDKDKSDVAFIFGEEVVYANSGILAARSVYFRQLFFGEWAESIKYAKRNQDDLDRQETEMKFEESVSEMKFMVHITDFMIETFSEMLRFLYTETIEFNEMTGSPTSPINMFIISDKYFLNELRNLAKAKIIWQFQTDTIIDFLFDLGYKWEDVKAEIIHFIHENDFAVLNNGGIAKICILGAVDEVSQNVMKDLLEELLLPPKDFPNHSV
ncbi:hypothetical protein G9A89_009838 [Geosiphon pyriformis]|nr:hypothetical protein G9A89_009838 [Geosiphon pyriformis]